MIKDDLKKIIEEDVAKHSSPIFMKRLLNTLEESGTDKASLTESAEKIGKMISLFIDKNMGNTISERLKKQIGMHF